MAIIAVNTRLLLKDKLEGIGVYSQEILSRLVKLNPQHRFIFLFDRNYNTDFIYSDNVTGVVVHPPTRHPLLWQIWFNWSVPSALKKYKTDLFFSPDGYLSLRTNVKQVSVIHDLNFELYPEFVPKNIYRYYHKNFPLFAQKAQHIFTVSGFSKKEIERLYQVDSDKITVTYNAASNHFKPLDVETKVKVRKQFTNGAPYFVYAGSLHQRKNIANMLLAYDAFKRQFQSPVKLLLAGNKMFADEQSDAVYENMHYKESVIFAGRLSDTAMSEAMGASIALLYVSFFEGFGIPIVEAMNCGVPVITSNTSSMPEVAGDAAILVNPNNVSEITQAMHQLATQKELRDTLIEKGNERKKIFSWDESAQKVSMVLNNFL
ncbi:MAG: glycosyltransferase family 4 protein [Bacteroidetes bacterium]|nr:glycosyltransferase family 4 protein [Bacteroidota bacterium]